jgi:diaminopimelate epimerase
MTTPDAREVTVETMAGIRKTQFFKVAGKVARVRAGMGEPRFAEKDIPADLSQGASNILDIKSMLVCDIPVGGRELKVSLVSMGNPHAVYFSHDPVADFPLTELGPEVEVHRVFPRKVNFEVARVLDRGQIEARVWENGVGETLACGSGACAITVAARLHGFIDHRADIKLPGGILEIDWDGGGEVFLTGPAEDVFTGEWPDEGYPN